MKAAMPRSALVPPIFFGHCLYSEIISKYQEYVKRYGICTVVFDGYRNGPSAKNHEQERRRKGSTITPEVSVEMQNSIGSMTKDSFLANPCNKSKFIDVLATALESDGHEVIRCKGDADTSIVSAVLDHCCEGENVVLLAADTDLLIMLLYFWNDLMGHVIMKSEGTKRHKTIERNIGEMAQCLEDVRGFLTIAHAFTGCDTTSAVFDQGKASIIKLFEKSPEARKIAGTFLKTDTTQDVVGEAGLKLFVLLYGGKSSDTLSSLRFTKYLKMTSVSSALKPEKLPPSERAAWFHSHRVYFQVRNGTA